MARTVRTSWRRLKRTRPDVHEELAKSGRQNLTSSVTYRRMKKKRIRPVTKLATIREMARRASTRSGVPIKISKDMKRHKRADGVTIRDGRNVEVHLHPVLKYYDKRYIRDVIGHELDHAKVMKRPLERRV